MSTVTLIVILLVPLVVLGGIAMVAAFAFALRTRSPAGGANQKSDRPDTCPECGHKLQEVLNYCAKCGAPIKASKATTES